MKYYLKNIFTSADNTTFSASKLIGVTGGLTMIGEFIRVQSVDWQGFGIGISTIIAALAAKAYTDKAT